MSPTRGQLAQLPQIPLAGGAYINPHFHGELRDPTSGCVCEVNHNGIPDNVWGGPDAGAGELVPPGSLQLRQSGRQRRLQVTTRIYILQVFPHECLGILFLLFHPLPPLYPPPLNFTFIFFPSSIFNDNIYPCWFILYNYV